MSEEEGAGAGSSLTGGTSGREGERGSGGRGATPSPSPSLSPLPILTPPIKSRDQSRDEDHHVQQQQQQQGNMGMVGNIGIMGTLAVGEVEEEDALPSPALVEAWADRQISARKRTPPR